MEKEITKDSTVIFTDGASRGNPGKGGWGSVIITPGRDAKVFELGGREEKTTNNRMELMAIKSALIFLVESDITKKIIFYTDSSYAIQGITQWIGGWKKNGWQTRNKTDVLNKDLWEPIDTLIESLDIEWKHVRGHVGIPGNERADEIATAFADEKDIDLANKLPLDSHKVELLNFSFDEKAQEESKEKRARTKMKAHSYLSLVNGVVVKHDTWDECNSRVKGQANVKFRKSISEEDEKKILDEWGVELTHE